MFGKVFKQKKSNDGLKDAARRMYGAALARARRHDFYESHGVPDSFDGRFDMLLLHIFMILNKTMDRPDYDDLALALFDETFKDMDQILREMGIGDMGIPKHMRRMMKAFNGRMHAYQLAVDPARIEGKVDLEAIKPASLDEALRRNLFGTVENPDTAHIEWMRVYVLRTLNGIQIDESGDITFESEES